MVKKQAAVKQQAAAPKAARQEESIKTRVYLIDDHHVVRQAVVEMLGAESDVAVVGQSGDVRGALEAIVRERPDIAIVDLRLPGMNGLAAIKEIRARAPDVGIIVFTMYDSPAYVHESINLGARGYVLKSGSKSDLLSAVRAVFNDGVLLPNTELGHIEIRGKDAETRASARVREEKDLSFKKWGKQVDDYLDQRIA